MLPLITLGISAAGAGGGLLSAFAGARARERETREAVRRFEAGAARTLSETRALGGEAAGVSADSASLVTYMRDMRDEFRRQAEWMRKTGEAEAGLARTAGVLGAAAGLGGALFSYGAARNWWRAPTLGPSTTPAYVPGSGMPPWR